MYSTFVNVRDRTRIQASVFKFDKNSFSSVENDDLCAENSDDRQLLLMTSHYKAKFPGPTNSL